MTVYIVTRADYDMQTTLGVYDTPEAAEQHRADAEACERRMCRGQQCAIDYYAVEEHVVQHVYQGEPSHVVL